MDIIPSSSSIGINSNHFESIIDKWLDHDSDSEVNTNGNEILESEYDANSEILNNDLIYTNGIIEDSI